MLKTSPVLEKYGGTRFVLALLLICHAYRAAAQDEVAASEAMQRVQDYRISAITSDGEVELKLIPKSLMNWSNPVFGTTDGGLFLWVQNERPAVLMKTYKTKNNRWFEQVRSLSTDRIVARDADGEVFWSPESGAAPMQPLPGTDSLPAIAPTDVSRMMQMKKIHRQFIVRGEIQGAGGDQQLRALPRPLYRYKNDQVTDGMMLGFVQGTGPDVVLILEARDSGDGQAKWYYRFASVGIFKVDVYLGDELIWSEPRRSAQSTRPTDLYDGRRLPL